MKRLAVAVFLLATLCGPARAASNSQATCSGAVSLLIAPSTFNTYMMRNIGGTAVYWCYSTTGGSCAGCTSSTGMLMNANDWINDVNYGVGVCCITASGSTTVAVAIE